LGGGVFKKEFMITPENLFTELSESKQDEFVSFLPWVEVTIDLDINEIKRRYHIAAKTFLSYEGIDL